MTEIKTEYYVIFCTSTQRIAFDVQHNELAGTKEECEVLVGHLHRLNNWWARKIKEINNCDNFIVVKVTKIITID